MEQTKTRVSDEILDKLSKIASPNISDAMGRAGGMSYEIRPMYRGAKLCGPAYTVQNYSKDNLMSHYALKHSQSGDVLVIDSRCGHGSGWGELMSLAAQKKGLGGIIVDGSVRDIYELEEIGFPIFAKGVQAEGTVKSTPGKVNCPVSCGGLTVMHRDIIVGDENGVVVIPLGQVTSVLEAAQAIQDKEESIRPRIMEGEALYDILNINMPSK